MLRVDSPVVVCFSTLAGVVVVVLVVVVTSNSVVVRAALGDYTALLVTDVALVERAVSLERGANSDTAAPITGGPGMS